MVSLLIPFVALLAVVKATNFKEDVKIDFRLRETPGHPAKFIDSTQYASAESKARLSKQGDKMTDIVGQLVFTRTEESREIKWSGTGDDGKLVQKRCVISVPVEPVKERNYTYDLLAGKLYAGAMGGKEADVLKVDCSNLIPIG